MEQVQLGRSDLRVSRVGLGCNNFGGRTDLEATRAVVDAAIDAGVRFFDTAELYGGGDSERFLGEILDGRREQVVVATKFGWGTAVGDGRAETVRSAIAGSLERLRTDYVDLYYLHKADPATPVAETLGALHELVEEGTVRAIGCSNFSAEQLVEADRVATELGTARFEVVQNRYSLLERGDDEDVLPLCRELGISYIPYFPLASGLLPESTAAASLRPRGRGSRDARSRRSASPGSRRWQTSPRSAGTRCSSSRSARSRPPPESGRSSRERRVRNRCGRTPRLPPGASPARSSSCSRAMQLRDAEVCSSPSHPRLVERKRGRAPAETRGDDMRPRTTLAVFAGIAFLAVGGAQATSGKRPSACPLPRGSERVPIDPADFTTRIDNPWWPMTPGSRWTYRETDPEGPTLEGVVTVTRKTKRTAEGVTTRIVSDVARHGRTPVEVTDDYYAQDRCGNIWYFGEATTEYRNGKPQSTAGSFEAGVDGAQPGVIVPAEPRPGLSYRRSTTRDTPRTRVRSSA